MSYIDLLQEFLLKQTDKQKIIVIYGPTWSWKTNMSIEIAKLLKTEIISTDSRQIFRYMNIGTGKVTQEEMQEIPHHMIDILNPDEKFSMGGFVRQSEKIMQKLWSENKIPMLVWGTGLYIDSLIFQRNSAGVSTSPKLRKELDSLTNQELYEKLVTIDPDYAAEIHPNNRPYIERGIEIKILTGKSKTEFRAPKKLLYDVLFLTPKAPRWVEYRDWLYDRINKRVEFMFHAWAETEVRDLLAQWYSFDDFGMNSIGYREFFQYFKGNITKQELIYQIQQNSRNYAKRQLKWFKKYQQYIS